MEPAREMNTARSEAELVTLRKLAEELARTRKERLTSVHLLAAVASRPGPAASLLDERRLDAEALLKAARSFDEDDADPVGRSMVAARELGKRSTLKEPGALHLVVALLADRRSAAHRALVHSGVDVGRLRTAAMQMVLGVVAVRRPSTAAATSSSASLEASPTRKLEPRPAPRPQGKGVAVPLFPPSVPSSVTPPASAPLPVMAPPSAPAPTPRAAEPAAPPAKRQNKRVAPPADGRFALDRAAFPALSAVGKNLTELAHQGQLEPVVGREDEIERALDLLAKRSQNSVCFVGPPGVGKTRVAEGLAARLGEPGVVGPRVLVEVTVADLVAGTGTRGALAEKIAAIRAEISRSKGHVVLFVDQLAELFAGGPLDEAASELKVALARGELALVGTVTPEELRRVIEADPSLARRFSAVEIDEPSREEAYLVLASVAERLALHHGVRYDDEALALSIAWSSRYVPGRALPDKAIGIVDLAGARVRRAAHEKLGKGKRGERGERGEPAVTAEDIAEIVAELSGVPVSRLLQTDRDRMLRLEELLAERVVGHREALAKLAGHLRRNAAGLRGKRPIGTFLLLGPTGVGKTETAKAIADVLFGSPDAMTRLDMSELAEPHSIARLIGAPPGYVGHEAGGQLTEAVRKRPYQVILLDEIEKAHRDVLLTFLQVFDEGRLTDGRGRSVDFTNTVLVLTSNLGAREATTVRGERPVGFARAVRVESVEERASQATVAAARSALPIELFNRIDEVLAFGALSRDDVANVARLQLGALRRSLEERGVSLEVDEAAIAALLVQGGFDEGLGARPMRRAITRLIEAPVADLILRGDIDDGSVILVTAEDGVLAVDSVVADRRAAAG
jgi:ATP-dependent Clp protease ATP-binding subunit ClpC